MNGTDKRFAEYIIWRTNEKQASLHIAVICYAGLICVLCTFGNGVVIYVYGCKLDRSVTNTFVWWIAITDMLMSSLVIPLRILDFRKIKIQTTCIRRGIVWYFVRSNESL
jgi:hypothetical protein